MKLKSRSGVAVTPRDGVFESRLCQGLSFASSRTSDIIGSSLQGRGGGLSDLDRHITSASDTWSYGRQAKGCGLEKAYHSGSLDPPGAARASHVHNWLVTPRKGGGLSNLDRHITSSSDTWSYGRQAKGCGLEKAHHSGSLDPPWGPK